MKIFVTGADGFIGSHLVEKLIKLGHKVKAFTFYNFRGSNGWLDSIDKKLLKDLHIISGDIRDYGFLEKQTKDADVIYHLAALIAIPYSYHSPQSYIDTNITGTYNAHSKTGRNCIINTGAIIEHDVFVGDNCHVSTGVILNGSVTIKKNTFIGSGTVVKNNVTIGKNCIIGMRKIIKKDLKDNSIVK